MQEIEIWVVIDEDGNYSLGADSDAAHEQYESDHNCSQARRVVRITLNVPLPKPLEIKATVPEETQEATVTVS